MRRWRFFLGRLELPAHFFLTLEQGRHLQLQTLYRPLLGDQDVIQCLDGVVLESQAALGSITRSCRSMAQSWAKVNSGGSNSRRRARMTAT